MCGPETYTMNRPMNIIMCGGVQSSYYTNTSKKMNKTQLYLKLTCMTSNWLFPNSGAQQHVCRRGTAAPVWKNTILHCYTWKPLKENPMRLLFENTYMKYICKSKEEWAFLGYERTTFYFSKRHANLFSVVFLCKISLKIWTKTKLCASRKKNQKKPCYIETPLRHSLCV